MKFKPNVNLDVVKEELKKIGKDITLDDVLEWDPTTWAHLMAVAAGLNPFIAPAIQMIPEALRAFLPRLEFKPAPEDRKNAFMALRKGLSQVNKAIVETTRGTYAQLLTNSIPNLQEMIQSQFPGGLEEFLGQLEKELMDYEKRKMYLQAGASMMDEEQAWVSKHHTLALGVVNWVGAQPKKCLTSDEFLGLVHDVGILENGQLTYTPFKTISNSELKKDVTAPINKMLQEAEDGIARSKQKLLDSIKKPKNK